jgi:uncharacterized paraquat-inducible protein A
VVAYTASTWTAVIVAASIFVPVIITIVLTWVFLRNWRHDPDEQRLKQVQADYEAQRARQADPRR